MCLWIGSVDVICCDNTEQKVNVEGRGENCKTNKNGYQRGKASQLWMSWIVALLLLLLVNKVPTWRHEMSKGMKMSTDGSC